ncbi:MAG: mitochondrial fission ELM1 family protein, partial [Candidatus Omnitrophica bacterium]|nr:mitochondrial fission ELM1 family protein [Candidatus Omnitrophota bacterium]
VVAGILGLSKVAVVTGESVSMISEAVSSRRPVLAVIPPGWKVSGRRGYTNSKSPQGVYHGGRVGKFLESMDEGGFLSLVGEEELRSSLERIWHAPRAGKVLDDRIVVEEALQRVLA